MEKADTPLVFVHERADGSFAVNERASAAWDELAIIFAQVNATLPLCFFPPRTQLETFFHCACRAHGVPSSSGTVHNLQWTVATFRLVGHDVLVTTAELFPQFVDAVHAAGGTLSTLTTAVVVGDEQVNIDALQTDYPDVLFHHLADPRNISHD